MTEPKFVNPYHLFCAREDLQARGIDYVGWGDGDLLAHYEAHIEPYDEETGRRHAERNSRWWRWTALRGKLEAEEAKREQELAAPERDWDAELKTIIPTAIWECSPSASLAPWWIHDLGEYSVHWQLARNDEPAHAETSYAKHPQWDALVRLVCERNGISPPAEEPKPKPSRDWDAEVAAVPGQWYWDTSLQPDHYGQWIVVNRCSQAVVRYNVNTKKTVASRVGDPRVARVLLRLVRERNVMRFATAQACAADMRLESVIESLVDEDAVLTPSAPRVADHDGRLGEIARGS